eukprot:TRINITY_DN21075_c0_g1_i1.p1 TRINITY_DN21075_c0_g1~~TRINITY_DN21075_c0_g1_i1.p1  ORF type:complete len:278 (-),score=68.70 TRINITY_DN21075_c0_g1_i1:221-1054(-)
MLRRLAVGAALLGLVEAGNRTIVVTGATGRSGSDVYLLLKSKGANVRGIVRDVEKARTVLGCSKCDESEGIFIGDITNQTTLLPAMSGADTLVIATGIAKGEKPEDILFHGVQSQFGAFLSSPGPSPQDRHVLQISMMETTLLDTIINKIIARFWGGWSVGFYSLQGEAALMDANVPFTILKACGLDDGPAKVKQLDVGHYDKGWGKPAGKDTVSRRDIARILAAAALNPKMSTGLRFDICSQAGSPQNDELEVLQEAMFSWDPRKQQKKSISAMLV